MLKGSKFCVSVSCLRFLNTDQIWASLLLIMIEPPGQAFWGFPNQQVKLSCHFVLLHVTWAIDGFHHCPECLGLLGLMSQKVRLLHYLGKVQFLVASDDFHCSYLESLSTEIVCQIVKVTLSESACDFRIFMLHCKTFLLCLDELAHQCNHWALENAFFSVS